MKSSTSTSTSTSTSCAVALAAGNAHAATYVVQAKALNFSAALANKITAAGDQVRARYPRIGAAIAALIIGAAGASCRSRGWRMRSGTARPTSARPASMSSSAWGA
ncbi:MULTISPECIES: hypothetical protein [unclassified Lysobacter]|uniref:hypothetical protein n=1 Tax=unclassified Lysobacter TaxID=2635362 RepID=UPI0012F9D7F3|nr:MULTISPECIES: hypothetical protein [unclassified Lysobacter]